MKLFPPKIPFTPNRTGDGHPLGRLENAVMEAMWRLGDEQVVAAVRDELSLEKPVAYSTVKTTMERLAEKGILSRVKRGQGGKAYLYSPAITRVELERRIINSAMDRLVEQFPAAVASYFTDPHFEVSAGKMAMLAEAIERAQEDPDA